MSEAPARPLDHANASELRDRTRTRDAQDVRTYEVRFTDVDSFLDDLERDAKRDAIEGGIVRLAVVNRPASEQQVSDAFESGFNPNGDSHNPLYRVKTLQVAYLARGQMVKLQHDCGIALSEGAATRFGQHYADAGVEITRRCAEALLEAANKVQRKLESIDGLELRGGGLFVEDGPWKADADHAIQSLGKQTCATCGGVIYYSNNAWRHYDTGLAELLVDGRGRYGAIKKLDHLADPEEAGRQI